MAVGTDVNVTVTETSAVVSPGARGGGTARRVAINYDVLNGGCEAGRGRGVARIIGKQGRIPRPVADGLFQFAVGEYPLDNVSRMPYAVVMKQDKEHRPNKTQPSIFEVINKFATEEACIAHFEKIRWPEGPVCPDPKCQSDRVFKYDTKGKTGKVRHLYECVDCLRQFSVTVGTIFHDSHAPLTKWFLAIYLICSNKKGISAKELQRQLAVTYKTAWYMAHRIRLAMQEDSEFCQKFAGICEVDETYVGGKQKGLRGRAVSTNKVPVVAIKERTRGKIRMQAVDDCSASVLQDFIRFNAKKGAEIHTDEFASYLWSDSSEFAHEAVNHGETYVRYKDDGSAVHTNGVENVWSLFKRGIMGVFHKVSAKYLPLYLNEFEFRFNNRDEFNMMDRVLSECF